MVEYDTIEGEIWVLTEEGNEIVDKGSHEANVFEAIPAGDEGLSIPELQVSDTSLFYLLCMKKFLIELHNVETFGKRR